MDTLDVAIEALRAVLRDENVELDGPDTYILFGAIGVLAEARVEATV